MIENAEVILTDLPEAEEIVERNVSYARPANGSSVRFQELNWDEDLPQGLATQSDTGSVNAFDLIVAADCTYNPDSRSVIVPPKLRYNMRVNPII
jgi:hypothetical protein